MQARPCQSALGAKNQNIKQKEYCDKLIKTLKGGPHQDKKKKLKNIVSGTWSLITVMSLYSEESQTC